MALPQILRKRLIYKLRVSNYVVVPNTMFEYLIVIVATGQQ